MTLAGARIIVVWTERLLERHAEVDRLALTIGRAAAGSGATLVLEGPPGIGKSALLAVAADEAVTSGMTVARAVGGMLERDLPFNAVRQLLEPLVLDYTWEEQAALFGGAAAPAASLLGPAVVGTVTDRDLADDLGATLHALFWLVSNLADRHPLLLVADDAQWFDPPSLRFIAYLARRSSDLPVLLLVATRPPESGSSGDLLRDLVSDQVLQHMVLKPLSGSAVATMVRDRLGGSADDAFCAACADAAGGNPFITLTLLDALADADVAPHDAAAADVAEIGATAAGPAVLRRFRSLPATAMELVRGVAVLGPDASPHLVAQLADLDLDAAVEAIDVLVNAGLLVDERPLRLAHSIVQAAVLDELSPTKRSVAHAKAAALVADLPDAMSRVAAHLLETDPAGDAWRVDVLLEVGKGFAAHGASDLASGLLLRALAEPPPNARRTEVLAHLGRAEVRAGRSDAAVHLRAALGGADTQAERIDLTFWLHRALLAVDDEVGAVQTLIDLLPQLGDDEAVMLVEGAIASGAFVSTARVPLARPYVARLLDRIAQEPDIAGRIPLENHSAATLPQLGANTPAAVVGASAASVVDAWRAASPDEFSGGLSFPVSTLVACDHPAASDAIEWAIELADRRGDVFSRGLWLNTRAWLALRRGELAEAVADARIAIDALEISGYPTYQQTAVAFLCDALVHRGDVPGAEQVLVAGGYDGPLHATSGEIVFVALGRARLRAAQDRWAEAADDLRAVGERSLALGFVSPSWTPWRAELAGALVRLGQSEEALAIAREDVELSREFGTGRTIGVALRGLGTVLGHDDPEAAEAHLVEAVAVLDGSPAPLELVHALIELGVVRRRRNARGDARDALAQALDVATRRGAAGLAERARAELVAAGGKPRRTRLTGLDALTPTELRVASLAADGRTNREVAQILFLTVKTVETHLAHTYQKLGIRGRPELAPALVQA